GSFLFEPSGALLPSGADGCFRWPPRADPSASDPLRGRPGRGDPEAGTRGRRRFGPPERLPFAEGTQKVAASRDGRVVAQSMYNGYGMQPYVGGWILHPDRPGEPRRVMAGASSVDAAVSPDGRWVAFGIHQPAAVRAFESATGRQVRE